MVSFYQDHPQVGISGVDPLRMWDKTLYYRLLRQKGSSTIKHTK